MITEKQLSALRCSGIEDYNAIILSYYEQGSHINASELFLNGSIRQRNNFLKSLENSEDYQPSIQTEMFTFFFNLT